MKGKRELGWEAGKCSGTRGCSISVKKKEKVRWACKTNSFNFLQEETGPKCWLKRSGMTSNSASVSKTELPWSQVSLPLSPWTWHSGKANSFVFPPNHSITRLQCFHEAGLFKHSPETRSWNWKYYSLVIESPFQWVVRSQGEISLPRALTFFEGNRVHQGRTKLKVHMYLAVV